MPQVNPSHTLQTQADDDSACSGESVTPGELLSLAQEYDNAARNLRPHGRKGHALSWAPFRLCAIHAIELYLSALLRHLGHEAKEVRRMQHSLAERAERAMAAGLQLKKNTKDHLVAMTEKREYLMSRYLPDSLKEGSPITLLEATLTDVAKKVRARISVQGTMPGDGK